jgi:hypothetical protein
MSGFATEAKGWDGVFSGETINGIGSDAKYFGDLADD